MAQGQPLLTKVEVDGIDVTSYLKSWNIKDTEGDDYIKYASVMLDRSVSQVLTVSSEALSTKTINIWRGVTTATEKKVFSGEVTNFLPTGADIDLKCADKLYIAFRKTVTKSFDIAIDSEAGVLSEIFKTLINDYTDGDLVADNTSVINSGDTTTLQKFICRAETVYAKCKELADALGWIFYYKPSQDKVYFEPQAKTNQATVIQNGVNLVQSPVWDYASDKLINHVEARGAVQQVETTENGQIGTTAGYTTTDVLVSFAPVSAKVYADSANPPTTLREGGKKGVSLTYEYSIDQDEKKIVWNDENYTPGASDYVRVEFTYGLPTPVLVGDPASQAKYGIKKQIIQLKNVKDVDDAYVYAQSYLDSWSNPILTSRLQVIDISDLEVGQQVQVVDATNDINEWLMVNAVEMVYPYNRDVIRVGTYIKNSDNLVFNILKKIKALEEENTSEEELLTHYYPAINTYQLENRNVDIYNNQGSMILDSATRGELDVDKTGGGTALADLMIRLPGQDNTFKEFVYDSDFYDSANSSGVTWNTTTETITLTSTGYLVTHPVSKGVEWTSFRLTIGSDTGAGTITAKVKGASASDYQTPVLNEWTSFNDTVNDVYIKIENATDTSVIGNTYKDTEEFDAPAIKLELRNGD